MMTSDNLSQQITTYNQTTITQNSGNQTQEDWVNKLIAGGWAIWPPTTFLLLLHTIQCQR